MYSSRTGVNLYRRERTSPVDWRNQRVRFKLRDIYHPDPAKVLIDLHGTDVLTGTVFDMTDSGQHAGVFIVVDVEGIEEPVIVPVEQILDSLS
jgi:hypothetical protein